MNNLKEVFLCTSVSILSLLLIFLVIIRVIEQKTNIALNDYSMLPNQATVVDKVLLGRRNRGLEDGLNKAFRRGAIELVCTNQSDILLVMKDFVRYLSIYKSGTLSTDVRTENGVKKGQAKINQIDYLSGGFLETFASTPLSQTEIASIVQALKDRNFNTNTIRLGLSESNNAFTDNAKLSDVKILINQCKKIK